MENNQITQHDTIPESSAARLAYYTAFIPLAGLLFFILFGFLALVQIGKGRLGLNRLSKGLGVTIVFSILPLAGLIYWAELPVDYYIILNAHTKHGCYINVDGQDRVLRKDYYRFGQQFRAVTYGYYANGKKRSQATWVDGKLNGKSYYWYDNEQLRADEIFVNGKRHGRFTWYTRDGKLDRSMNYVDGISQEQIDAAKQAGVEPVIEVDLGGGVKMRMIFIPPGEFMMGSTEAEIAKVSKEIETVCFKIEAPQHKVTINQGFYFCETEVTQAQWQAITGGNPSRFKEENNPVERVNWNDIQECLRKLNTQGKDTFRLPSEAEWEYSARSGTTTSFSFGDDYADLKDYDWYRDNSRDSTHPVSGKKANNFGLYDIHGNVWERMEDIYHENYQGASSDGKVWVASPHGAGRMLRGGSWINDPQFCRSAFRIWIHPVDQDCIYGVRFARDITPQDKKP